MTLIDDQHQPNGMTAALPALVVAIHVTTHEFVEEGTPLLTTETMKCETTIRANKSGWVSELPTLGDLIEAGDSLCVIANAPPHAQQTQSPQQRTALWLPEEIHLLLTTKSELLPEAATGIVAELLDPLPADQKCGVTVHLVTHYLRGHEDGLTRVLICGDPRVSMGSVAEVECQRIMDGLRYAAQHQLAVEWIAVSAGARIAWDSGTENMDWCADVAREIVDFTQAGGAINIVVAGVNVGAQSYWNALATMLMHTSGMLIMLNNQAMVLTGRRALALSGGGQHNSETDMGGYDDIMGPNGQAHHRVDSLEAAYRMIFDHLAVCEPRTDRQPPFARTLDSADRSVADSPYATIHNGTTSEIRVGDVLHAVSNPKRKQPFAIEPVMSALVDHDAERLVRWPDMEDSHPAVVWDTRIGGWPVSLVGIESQPVQSDLDPTRMRAAGTLYPQSSKKIARALNAASGRRATVVLANLAGFDGSAFSMRNHQLELGAEIARAVVNYRGPVIVVVIGRFHGGAYVVFSRRLNPSVSILALEGTYVSVIGGDAAAGVVFHREVQAAVEAELEERITEMRDQGSPVLSSTEYEALKTELLHAHRNRIARDFDARHSVHRAEHVGSVDEIITPEMMRPRVIERIAAWPWQSLSARYDQMTRG